MMWRTELTEIFILSALMDARWLSHCGYLQWKTDVDGDEAEEILEAKKIIRKHEKMLNSISENLEMVW